MGPVLVCFTGGTIGSRQRRDLIDVEADASFLLLELYREAYGDVAEFVAEQPLNLLSENLTPAHWQTLIEALRPALERDLGGIIVTHGTDTLAYSAAAISFACGHTPVPVVLVGADRPLEDPASNGLRNFAAAVDLIRSEVPPGIYVTYERADGSMPVYLGSRLQQAAPFTDAFSSVGGLDFGRISEGRFETIPGEDNPTPEMLAGPRSHPLQERLPGCAADVLYIRPYPGLNYELFDLNGRRPAAVLHELYHSGTACTKSQHGARYALKGFVEQCQSLGVDVYIAPMRARSGGRYVTAQELLDWGAVPLPNMSVESALAKLILTYGTFEAQQDILDALQRPAFFEDLHGGRDA